MSLELAYLALGLVTAFVVTVVVIIEFEDDGFSAALFGILCGLGWPLIWLAVVLMVPANVAAYLIDRRKATR